MRWLIFSLLVLFSLNSYANDSNPPAEETKPPAEETVVPAEETKEVKKDEPPDKEVKKDEPPDKEVKIGKCVDEYVKKQARSYAKIVQDNLYDLIHNFERIASRIFGKKPVEDDKPREEKIEALAKVQCEMYYEMGILK